MTGQPGTCVMPDCPRAVAGPNRAGQGVCATHRRVVVSGSFVNDRHTEGGHG